MCRTKRDQVIFTSFFVRHSAEVHGITRASISIRAKTHAVYNMGFEPGFLHYEPEDQMGIKYNRPSQMISFRASLC